MREGEVHAHVYIYIYIYIYQQKSTEKENERERERREKERYVYQYINKNGETARESEVDIYIEREREGDIEREIYAYREHRVSRLHSNRRRRKNNSPETRCHIRVQRRLPQLNINYDSPQTTIRGNKVGFPHLENNGSASRMSEAETWQSPVLFLHLPQERFLHKTRQ